jgi:hypothetical protein
MGCSEVSHQKAHTQIGSNYKLIFLYMLKNIKLIHIYNLTRFECVLFDVKLHYTQIWILIKFRFVHSFGS